MSLDAFKQHYKGFLAGSGVIHDRDENVQVNFGEAFESMFKDGVPLKISINKPQEVEVIKLNG